MQDKVDRAPAPTPPALPDRTAAAAELAPVCVGCVGDRTNPDGGPCLRCKGTGRDPAAPAGIEVAS